MTELLFSSHSIECDGYTITIAFTSEKAGNLGLHVETGEPRTRTLAHRAGLEKALAGRGLAAPFLYLNQVHGKEVVQAEDYELSDIAPHDADSEFTQQWAEHLLKDAPQADAAFSATGRPLAIMVADCIPVVLIGQRKAHMPVIAVAHAGRPGLVAGVLQQIVTAMKDSGADRIRAWLGPSICGACYEVPQTMHTELAEVIPALAAQTRKGTPALDLPAGAIAVLTDLGVEVSTDLAACTYEDSGVYSHRGFTNRGEAAGRIAGLVWVNKTPNVHSL